MFSDTVSCNFRDDCAEWQISTLRFVMSPERGSVKIFYIVRIEPTTIAELQRPQNYHVNYNSLFQCALVI